MIEAWETVVTAMMRRRRVSSLRHETRHTHTHTHTCTHADAHAISMTVVTCCAVRLVWDILS